MRTIIKENLGKNILLIVILILVYFPIQNYLLNSNLALDKSLAGDALVSISIIAVIACFGNFAFTYEKVHTGEAFQRYLAHFTTALLMLVVGISLIFTAIITRIVVGPFVVTDIMFVILYIACVSYDFWDLFREEG